MSVVVSKLLLVFVFVFVAAMVMTMSVARWSGGVVPLWLVG